MTVRKYLDSVPKQELPDRIKQWLDLSSVRLTDDDLVTVDFRAIAYDAQEIRTFSRLASAFTIHQMKYLFNSDKHDPYFRDFDGKYYGIPKSNVNRFIYQNELTINKHLRLSYYNGFEIIIKSIGKSSVDLPYETLTYYADLLETTVENFNLLLKQDNILNDYTFKAAIYNKDDNTLSDDRKHISILLLNTKELITVS